VGKQIKDRNPALYAQALSLNSTGRMGTPQERANSVPLIASPAASFITTSKLLADGR
jgi:3-oxoacyl-[acyl-carrier protein] reductase